MLDLAAAVSSLRLSAVDRKEQPKKPRATKAKKETPEQKTKPKKETPKDKKKKSKAAKKSRGKKVSSKQDVEEGEMVDQGAEGELPEHDLQEEQPEEEDGDIFDDDCILDSDEEINQKDRSLEETNPGRKQKRAVKPSRGRSVLQKAKVSARRLKKALSTKRAEVVKPESGSAKPKAKAKAKGKKPLADSAGSSSDTPKPMSSFLAKQWLAYRKTEVQKVREDDRTLTYHEAMKIVAERLVSASGFRGCLGLNVGVYML